MMLAVCSQNPQLLEICSDVADEMEKSTSSPSGPSSALRPPFDAVLTTTGGGSISSKSSTSSARSSVFSSELSATSSSMLIPDANEDSQPQPKASKTKDACLDHASMDSLVIRQACRFDCYCECHSQSVAVSKDVFAKFNAPIFRERRRFKVDCTEPDCAGATSSPKRVLSSALFKRAMSHLLSYQSVKVRYDLNCYRIIPEGSNAMRYVKQGNLERLRMAVKTGEATPWDTAGWMVSSSCMYSLSGG